MKRILLLAALAACTSDVGMLTGDVIALAGHASNPTVAVNANGVVHVAWVATKDGASAVWVASSRDGVTFGEPVRANHIAGDAAPHEQAPAQVEAGPNDDVHVVWQRNTAAPGRRFPWSDVRFARSTDGGRSFEPAITVNDDVDQPPSSHTFHDLLVAPDGSVYVSWIDGRVRAALEAALGTAGSEPAAAGVAHAGGGMGTAAEAMLPGPEIRVARSAM